MSNSRLHPDVSMMSAILTRKVLANRKSRLLVKLSLTSIVNPKHLIIDFKTNSQPRKPILRNIVFASLIVRTAARPSLRQVLFNQCTSKIPAMESFYIRYASLLLQTKADISIGNFFPQKDGTLGDFSCDN